MAKPPKKASALLPKPKNKGYTKNKLINHLAAAASSKSGESVSKKHVGVVLDELASVLFLYAPVGAALPGLGKLVLRSIPAKPARTIISFGKQLNVPAKGKSQKLVFRFSKDAKAMFAK
jgi:hypothetical protein